MKKTVIFTLIIFLVFLGINISFKQTSKDMWPKEIRVDSDSRLFLSRISLDYISGKHPVIIQKINRIEYNRCLGADGKFINCSYGCIDAISIPNHEWARESNFEGKKRKGLIIDQHICAPGSLPREVSNDFSEMSVSLVDTPGSSSIYVYDDDIAFSNNIPISKEILLGFNTYLYPYDTIDLDLDLRFYGYQKMNGDYIQNDFPGDISWKLDFPGWEISSINENDLIGLRNSSNKIKNIKLVRPVVYRMLTPVLILLIVIFITYLLAIEDISSFAQSALAILFGIWTIRQILMPSGDYPPVALDKVFLLIYSLLTTIIFVWSMRRILLPKWNIYNKRKKLQRIMRDKKDAP
jgi:hypothetical protein